MADRQAREFNGEDDDDEGLRLAIAMSLGEEPAKKTPDKQHVVIDLTENEIDLTQDDIETASEASSPGLSGVSAQATKKSKHDVHKTKAVDEKMEPKTNDEKPSAGSASVSEPAPVSSFALLGLDRAKMEEERLARLRKRKAAEEGPSGKSDSKRIKTNDENRPPVPAGKQGVPKSVRQQLPQVEVPLGSRAKRDAMVMPSRPATLSAPTEATPFGARNRTNPLQQSQTTMKNAHSNLPFPKGVVKKTWVKGQRRLGDDIRLQEVLQLDKLKLALISSFQWDQNWMWDMFDIENMKTQIVLVAMGGDEAEVRSDMIAFSAICLYGVVSPGRSSMYLHLLAWKLGVFSFARSPNHLRCF